MGNQNQLIFEKSISNISGQNKKRSLLLIEKTMTGKENFNFFQNIEQFEVTQEEDSVKAIEKIRKKDFDLIIADLDIIDVKDIKSWIDSVKETNKILFAIRKDEYSAEKCREIIDSDIDDLINKPFCSTELYHKFNIHKRLREKTKTISSLKKGMEKMEEDSTNQLLDMFNDLQLAYKELDLRKRELESLDKAKSDFIKIVSHEIRTPLSGILGFSQLLESRLPTEYHEYLKSLNESAQRLQEFSNKAILISKLKTNNYKINKEPISLLHIVDSILEKHQPIIKKKHLFVRNALSHQMIKSDFYLSERALTHVIDNAIRYAPDNSHILIEELFANDKLMIMVLDEGPGFSDEIFNSLFGLFAHGEKYVDKNVGLGLYMVKLIMNYMGGNIRVSNLQDSGANVRLTFAIK